MGERTQARSAGVPAEQQEQHRADAEDAEPEYVGMTPVRLLGNTRQESEVARQCGGGDGQPEEYQEDRASD